MPYQSGVRFSGPERSSSIESAYFLARLTALYDILSQPSGGLGASGLGGGGVLSTALTISVDSPGLTVSPAKSFAILNLFSIFILIERVFEMLVNCIS
jgi:hypothetical protein